MSFIASPRMEVDVNYLKNMTEKWNHYELWWMNASTTPSVSYQVCHTVCVPSTSKWQNIATSLWPMWWNIVITCLFGLLQGPMSHLIHHTDKTSKNSTSFYCQGVELGFQLRIGLDENLQDWILTKARKCLSRQNSTKKFVYLWGNDQHGTA